ncbi:hypothetical protein EIP86_006048 [Pleurotus ostreatoroseus]|nr:hypothetical protein EIP86_006048 [Pleurotus ostreatoroseus]
MSDDHDSDVFDGTGPTIVDCDVLEAAKENIQPIAAGRRVTALSAILSTPHALRESRLAATRNRLRINVEIALEDEEDDPLEAYCRFVYWVVENYPQGHSAESGLLELLEEATRVLKDDRDGQWRGDIRYLKLWVLYASYVEKPAIIFKFCLVNDIGTNHAVLYEEFALALERAGRKTAADEIYQLGVARKASPFERLESRYREFQKRMMNQVTANAASEPEGQSNSVSPQENDARRVLGDASRARPSTKTQETPDVFTLPSDVPPPSRNSRMQVFIDPSGEDATKTEDAPWEELGTRKSRVKENLVEVSKAAGTILKQAGKSKREAAARAPKMAVYRDLKDIGQRLDDGAGHASSSNQSEDLHSGVHDKESRPIGNAAASPDHSQVTSEQTPSDETPEQQVPSAKISPPARRGMTTRSAAKLARSQGLQVLETPTTTRTTRSSARKTTQEDEPKHQVSKKATLAAGKSKVAVYKDEDCKSTPAAFPDPPAAPSKGKGKGKRTVFCDVPDPDSVQAHVSPSASADGQKTSNTTSKLMVYRDEETESADPVVPEPHVPPVKAALPKFSVLRDEEARPPPKTAKLKGKGLAPKLTVYRDDETQETENIRDMAPPTVVPRKASSSSTSKIPVFRDEAPAHARLGSAPAAKIAVYRDEPESSGADLEVPSTPRFAPYLDEDLYSRTPAPMSVMKDKSVALGGTKGVKMSSEGEALRKDPLKNYADEDKVLDLD